VTVSVTKDGAGKYASLLTGFDKTLLVLYTLFCNLAEFQYNVSYKTLLCMCEFRGVHIREGYIFPGDVNDIAVARVPWNRVAY
jgi:hypothetical protein